jgi:hypothetical protein
LVRPLAALALWTFAAAAFARPPDFPPPDDAKVSAVGDSMVILGRQMTVRAFVTDDAVDDVVAFYQELWQDPPAEGAPGVAYEPDLIAPWHLLTRVEDGYIMTVQVKPHGREGAMGYLAMGLLHEPGEGPPPLPDPPAPNGSKVMSNFASEDPGKQAQTAVVANHDSLSSNVNFYRSYYQDWRKDTDQAFGRQAHALSFTRGRRQVTITIKASREGSQIVVNSVEHDLL